MGGSDDRKRSKKAKASKRAKKAKRAKRLTLEAASQDRLDADAGLTLSQETQSVVIEMQKAELTRLLREQQRLNERVDQLMRLHEREQVLRQQMQAALDKLAEQRTLPPPSPQPAIEHRQLVERVDRAEHKFAQLRSAVGLLVGALERQTVSA